MNDTPTSDPLLWEALPDLTLNIAQTAALCGISVRQLGYWTRQGYVTAQGRGVRRTYGLEAVQRVLAIRKAMDAGASLRQSLRQVAVSNPLPFTALPPSSAALLPSSSATPRTPAAASSLPPDEAEALAQTLQALFEMNPHTRDHAGGLAVKLGRAEDDVRTAAESLCAAGILQCGAYQGMTIFRRPEGKPVYV